MLFAIQSGKNHNFFRENCVKKNVSFEDFKACVRKNRIKTPLIKTVGIKSFEKQSYLNSYTMLDILFLFYFIICIINKKYNEYIAPH